MKNDIKLVCVDMFQTLVNVNDRKLMAGERMLKALFTEPLAAQCWDDATSLVMKYFGSYQTSQGEFRQVKHGFIECYKSLWGARKYEIDPVESAHILASEHALAPLFEDAQDFMRVIGEKYPICLVSDADEDMILPLLSQFRFDKIFVSETHQCYKVDSKLFLKVLEHYQLQPQDILHIGDGYSDVAGAKKIGIVTCWLNRGNREWVHEIKPDYEIHSLSEVVELLSGS